MNLHRFLTVARHELRRQLTGPVMWILLVVAVLLTLSINTAPMLGRGSGADEDAVRLFNNTPFALAFVFGVLGYMVYGFFASIAAGMAVIRDDELNVGELLHATPLTAAEYGWGKLAGVMAALGLVLGMHLAVAVAHFQFGPLDGDLDRGPFRVAAYLTAALWFALPAVWAFAALAFAAGAWTRRPLAVFVVPAALFLAATTLGLQSLLATTGPGLDRVLMVLDPSGLRWLFREFFLVDRGVAFYNTAAMPLAWPTVVNRILVLGLPLLAAALAIRRCGSTVATGARGRRQEAPAPAPRDTPTTPTDLASLGMGSTAPRFLRTLWTLTGVELRDLARQPAIYLFAALLLGLVAEGATSGEGPYGGAPILTAGRVAVGSLGALTLLLCLLTMVTLVESFRRDRATGFDAIGYAAPFPTSALVLAKSLATALVAAFLVLAAAALVVVSLATQPVGRVEFGPLLAVYGLLVPPTLALWCAIVAAVYAGSGSRTTTYAVGIALLLLTFLNLNRDFVTWVVNWTLAGTLRWTDFASFPLNRQPLIWNRLLVAIAAFALAAFAVRRYGRVERDPRTSRFRTMTAGPLIGIAVVLILATALGLAIRSGFQGGPARDRAARYARAAANAQATDVFVEHLDVSIDLEPARHRARIEGRYRMDRPAGAAAAGLSMTLGPAADDVAWTIDGNPVVADDRAGLHVFHSSPASPFELGFAYDWVLPRGPTRNGGGIPQFILPAGVALHTLRDSFLPTPGPVEPSSPLPERPPFTTRMVVTVPGGFTANAVGDEVSRTTAAGRTTVTWESAVPVGAVNVVAGRWSVRRQEGVAVFHHPGHPYNVGEMLDALAAARRRYSEWFHPYPWHELRLSEFPDLVTNAQGFATNIPFSEGIGFLTRGEPGARATFLVVAHEAAHQWWANTVQAGHGPGTDHLVEGLAHFSALQLLEAEHGEWERMEFSRKMEASYIRRRRVDTEKPLSATVDGGTAADWAVIYEKGAWVQSMLHDLVGREPARAALGRFATRCFEDRSRPQLADLLTTLREAAPDPAAYDAFVEQWFHDIVLPEFRIVAGAAEATGSGWRTPITVENVGTGAVAVEVAAAAGERFGESTQAYREARTTFRLEPGVPREAWIVSDFPPRRVVVDPDVRVLQLNRDRAWAEPAAP